VALSATDGIEVDSGSPITTSGTIAISLTAASLASLALADSAAQPGDNVSSFTNDAGYTTNTGTVTSVALSASDGIEVDSGSPITGSGTIAISLTAASLASLALADSAAQPGDNVSSFINDAGYTTNTGTVTSVALSATDGVEVDSGSPITGSGTIAVSLTAASLASLALADTSSQPGDNVSDFVNDAGYITGIGAFDTDDLSEGSTNFYFTDERAQDAVGAMADSTLTYVDGTPALGVADGGIDTIQLADDGVTAAKVDETDSYTFATITTTSTADIGGILTVASTAPAIRFQDTNGSGATQTAFLSRS
jgi:peptidyl-tRNA hydrolase